MSHIEPDDLATLALDGTPPPADVAAHLAACADCRSEYDALVRTVQLGREPGRLHGAETFESPSSDVWAGIHAELGLAAELASDPLRAPDPALDPERPRAIEPTVRPEASASGRATQTARRRWWPIAAAAAVIGVVAGIAVGAAWSGFSTSTPEPTVVASATLEAFPGWTANGDAVLEEDDDGVTSIVVDLDADVPSDQIREVWLIRSDASGLVSLGLLSGSSGRFVVPANIDLDEFTLVDVSAEPVDGDPGHSGASIVRGTLERV
jgi:anti-sigma-K factor RskA